MEVGSGVFSLIFSRMNRHSLLWSFLPQGFLQISFQFSLVGILLISTWILWISFLDSGCSQISLSSSLVPCLNFAKFGSSRGAMFFAPLFDISLSLDWLSLGILSQGEESCSPVDFRSLVGRRDPLLCFFSSFLLGLQSWLSSSDGVGKKDSALNPAVFFFVSLLFPLEGFLPIKGFWFLPVHFVFLPLVSLRENFFPKFSQPFDFLCGSSFNFTQVFPSLFLAFRSKNLSSGILFFSPVDTYSAFGKSQVQ